MSRAADSIAYLFSGGIILNTHLINEGDRVSNQSDALSFHRWLDAHQSRSSLSSRGYEHSDPTNSYVEQAYLIYHARMGYRLWSQGRVHKRAGHDGNLRDIASIKRTFEWHLGSARRCFRIRLGKTLHLFSECIRLRLHKLHLNSHHLFKSFAWLNCFINS